MSEGNSLQGWGWGVIRSERSEGNNKPLTLGALGAQGKAKEMLGNSGRQFDGRDFIPAVEV